MINTEVIFKRCPDYKKIEKIVIMEGVVYVSANVTPVVEFNFYIDLAVEKLLYQVATEFVCIRLM
jgi:inosine-uridine nucleoside N-ribohydrolase